MASGIVVTPERLREVSAQVGAGAAEVDAILSRLAAAVAPIRVEWTGAAQAQFETLWDQWQRDASDVQTVLTGLAKLIQKAATSYAATDEVLARSFNTFLLEAATNEAGVEPVISTCGIESDQVHAIVTGFGELVGTLESIVGRGRDLANGANAPLPQAAGQLVEQSNDELTEVSGWFSQMDQFLSASALDSEAVVDDHIGTEADESVIDEAGPPVDRPEASTRPPWVWASDTSALDSEAVVDDHVGTEADESVIDEAGPPVDRPEASTRPPWGWFPRSKSRTHNTKIVDDHIGTETEESPVETGQILVDTPLIEHRLLQEEPSESQGIRLDKPRPLNQAEQGILDALLVPEFPGVVELRAQVPYARVVAVCDCGCPSVDLLVPSEAPLSGVTTYNQLAPVKGWVTPESDESYGKIVLRVDGGRIAGLEYVSKDYPTPPTWPSLDRLAVERTDRPVNAGEVLT